MSAVEARFRAVLGRLRRFPADTATDAQTAAAQAALLALIARLRPDLSVDDAVLEVDLTLAEFSEALDPEPGAPRPRRGRHLYALTGIAATSAGLAADRVAAALSAYLGNGLIA